MGGQKFEYDESGGTFFYFLLSFLALLLIPGTYYWWPRKRKQDPEKIEKECQCNDCKRKKITLQSNEPWKGTKQLLTKLLIISGWVILGLLAYKVSQFDYEMANFDPYEILGVPMGSSQADIKKSYRKQSLVLHPDKETGNEKAFMKLTKAYQALTDDEARRNWEKYGNPDGPGAMSFGIALPSWIVEKENSVWVLGLYALVFMVALPTVVGMWWYKSIRYSGDKVLLDTTQLYYFFFHKTPSMALKRVIMILAASLEFEKKHNNEIVERSTDSEEIPHLIKQITNLSEKNREPPLCYFYSIKARALLHAQLNRIAVNPETIGKDQQYIVKKCPYLIQEMVNCVSQLILLAYARRIPRLPNVETIENCMKLCPMVVQALLEFKSPLLQLPHIKDEHLKYFNIKKRHIKSLMQFAQLRGQERRFILRYLSDEQYSDAMKVLGQMPIIDFKVTSEVIDDENPTVYTAGAIVTVTVTLERRDMSTVFGDDSIIEKNVEEEEAQEEEVEKVQRPAWQRQQRKAPKKSGGKKSSKPAAKGKKETTPLAKKADEKEEGEKKEGAEKKQGGEKKRAKEENDDSGAESDETGGGDMSDDEDTSQQDKKESSVEDDDAEWEKFQTRLNKRDKGLEGRTNQSHSVHCPFYPEDKQEFWWVYMSDRKSHTLLTSPCHVTALVDTEELQLKFTAPRWPGVYTFTVCLRSDSYLGFDQSIDIKLDVKEAPEVSTEHPQWAALDDEEEEQGGGGGGDSDISEFTTDDDVEDDDD